ncbi:MAG: DUF126 domain-containing protein [Pseudomonadota bacterium]
MTSWQTLYAGDGAGPYLRLSEPISFWGGVDPATGLITTSRHPQCGENIGGSVLALPPMIGSSSSSGILLELLRSGAAPAAMILAEVDAILIMGCVVGRELKYPCPPVVVGTLPDYPNGTQVRVNALSESQGAHVARERFPA